MYMHILSTLISAYTEDKHRRLNNTPETNFREIPKR